MPSFDSPYYPYDIVQSGSNALNGVEKIPYQLLKYLLDMPDANGYTPTDDNTRPRVRLAKYLYYDGGNPLGETLPTPQQKLSMLYNPEQPSLNTDERKSKHPVGYRMFWQHTVKQSLLDEKAFVKCFIGQIFSPRPHITTIGIQFEIWVGAGMETAMETDVESRSFAIEQAITASLANVNITGIGTVSFLRSEHASNGSRPIYASEGTILGRALHCSISWSDATESEISGFCDVC